jgi:hypothetical protein
VSQGANDQERKNASSVGSMALSNLSDYPPPIEQQADQTVVDSPGI